MIYRPNQNPGPLFTPHNGTPTSKAAAEQKTDAASDRTKMLAAYRAAGAMGLTDDEMRITTNLNPDSIRPRRGELIRAGKVMETTKTRPTRTGRLATVFIAVTKGANQ